MDIPTCIILIVSPLFFALGFGTGRLYETGRYMNEKRDEHQSIRRMGRLDMLIELCDDALRARGEGVSR